ncbi:hypothetical protein QQ054_05540 [Oscillatoria amoena NRMC-F 0135]|nr:hypothetical protein [Oscillatoria amoena NRMC-F 0135]
METLNPQEELDRINLEVAETQEDLGDEPVQENLTYEISTDHDDDTVDYGTLGKEELVELAIKAAAQEDLKDAGEIMRNIRPLLDNIFADEYNAALAAFIEEGNDKDSFEYKGDGLKDRFYEAYKALQRRRAQEREKSRAREDQKPCGQTCYT